MRLNPEQEEFFIRRCGYDRNSLDKMVAAAQRGDQKLSQKIDVASQRAGRCILNETEERRKGTLAKLRAGWLPPTTSQR